MDDSSIELIGMGTSPYTEKARWALDHHRIPYRYREHLVLFGMPALRWKTRAWRRELTLPVLIDGETRCFDSFEIAQYADWAGARSPLFIKGQQSEHVFFNSLSETGLDAGRGLLMTRLRNDSDAKVEYLPKPFRWAGRSLTPLVDLGLSYIQDEFAIGSDADATSAYERSLRSCLTTLRNRLKTAGGTYLLGEVFSYADICMGVVLQFVEPVESEFFRLGPATRRCWRHEGLKCEFADLIEWRNQLYKLHRIGTDSAAV